MFYFVTIIIITIFYQNFASYKLKIFQWLMYTLSIISSVIYITKESVLWTSDFDTLLETLKVWLQLLKNIFDFDSNPNYPVLSGLSIRYPELSAPATPNHQLIYINGSKYLLTFSEPPSRKSANGYLRSRSIKVRDTNPNATAAGSNHQLSREQCHRPPSYSPLKLLV